MQVLILISKCSDTFSQPLWRLSMSASAAEILLQHQEEKSCEITRGNTIQTAAGTIVKHNNNNKTTSASAGGPDLEAASSAAAASKLTSENSKQNLQTASTEAITASGNTAAATYARNLLLVHK